MASEGNVKHILTLGNSIIGVSILAMPYCFKQCGLLLGIILLFVSSYVNRLNCHFLVKSAVATKRRSYEFLAFQVFGAMGKFAIEVIQIGFLLGICVSFFVIAGDLGPKMLAKLIGVAADEQFRATFLICMCFIVVLPLCLLRNIDSLANISAVSLSFYMLLVLKIFADSWPHIMSGSWLSDVVMWRPEGVLQTLPIMGLALACQTNLFSIYESLPDPTLSRMNSVVAGAINLCCSAYILVGFFGYVALHDSDFGGNLLLHLAPSSVTMWINIGFVMSIAMGFPLIIYPCRVSLNSLLFRRASSIFEVSGNYIPEFRFKCITFCILSVSLIVGILIPSIEVVLGLLGSTMGTAIAILFPSAMFIKHSNKDNLEKTAAHCSFVFGVILLFCGTYVNLYAVDQLRLQPAGLPGLTESHMIPLPNNVVSEAAVDKLNGTGIDVPAVPATLAGNKPGNQVRHEPAAPEPPDSSLVKLNKSGGPAESDGLDKLALKKEKEEQDNDKSIGGGDTKVEEKQEKVLKQLKEAHKEQKALLKEQKQLLEEMKKQKLLGDEANPVNNDVVHRNALPTLQAATLPAPGVQKPVNPELQLPAPQAPHQPILQGAQGPAPQAVQQPAQPAQQPFQGEQQFAQGIQQPVQGAQQPVQGAQQPVQGAQQTVQGVQQLVQGGQQPIQGILQPAQGFQQFAQQPIQAMQQPVQGIQQLAQGAQQPNQGILQPAQGFQQSVQAVNLPVQGAQQPVQGVQQLGAQQPVQGAQQTVQGVQQLVQGGQQPIQGILQPAQGFQQFAQQPIQAMQQPVQEIQQLAQGAQQPNQGIQQPAQGFQQSVQAVNLPVQGAPQSVQGAQQPVQGVQQLVQGAQQPVQGAQQTVQGVQQLVQGGQQPIQGILQPAQGFQQFAQQPIQAMQQPVQEIQQLAQGAQQPNQGIQQPAQGSQQSVQAVNLSVQGAQQPVQGAQQPVQGAQQPVQGAQQSVQGAQQLVQRAQQPVQRVQQPAQGVQQAVQGLQQPAHGLQQFAQQQVPGVQKQVQEIQRFPQQPAQEFQQPVQGTQQLSQGIPPIQGSLQSGQIVANPPVSQYQIPASNQRSIKSGSVLDPGVVQVPVGQHGDAVPKQVDSAGQPKPLLQRQALSIGDTGLTVDSADDTVRQGQAEVGPVERPDAVVHLTNSRVKRSPIGDILAPMPVSAVRFAGLQRSAKRR